MAKVSAYEIKACGIPLDFSSNWFGTRSKIPWQFETFGEDPYLTQMANQWLWLSGEKNQISTPKN